MGIIVVALEMLRGCGYKCRIFETFLVDVLWTATADSLTMRMMIDKWRSFSRIVEWIVICGMMLVSDREITLLIEVDRADMV